jgi:hypothetical protein
VIAVAVIMDNPKGSYYGASVSAPVFAEVAQQVLEYLAVPHDIDVHRTRAAKAAVKVAEDDAEQTGDINALTPRPTTAQRRSPARRASPAGGHAPALPPRKTARQHSHSSQNAAANAGAAANARANPPQRAAPARPADHHGHRRRRKNPARSLAHRPAGAQGHRTGRRRRLEVEITGTARRANRLPLRARWLRLEPGL